MLQCDFFYYYFVLKPAAHETKTTYVQGKILLEVSENMLFFFFKLGELTLTLQERYALHEIFILKYGFKRTFS